MPVFSLWVVMKLIACTAPANMIVFRGAFMQCSLGYHIFIVGFAGGLRMWRANVPCTASLCLHQRQSIH